MAVYFAYRSHYEGPSGKHVRALDGETVLGWFQGVWGRAKAAEDVAAWVEAELGTPVYGFASVFEAAREHSLPPPTSDRKLKAYLEEHLYAEGEVKYRPHALQVLTDDDEIELAYYVFDDHYLDAHPGRAAYLLHEGWRLPTTSGETSFAPRVPVEKVRPSGTGEGTSYLAFLAFYDSGGLTDLDEWGGPCRIEGVRVPELAEYLAGTAPDDSWPFELGLLRSQLRPDEPEGERLGAALGRVARLPVIRISEEDSGGLLRAATVEDARGRLEGVVKGLKGVLDHDPSKSLVGASNHLAQLCLHAGDVFGRDVFHQWIIFDDLWAGEHPDLAEGIFRFAKRWDVLTV